MDNLHWLIPTGIIQTPLTLRFTALELPYSAHLPTFPRPRLALISERDQGKPLPHRSTAIMRMKHSASQKYAVDMTSDSVMRTGFTHSSLGWG